jgi:hypothetical protein
MRTQIRRLTTLGREELVRESKELGAPLDLVTSARASAAVRIFSGLLTIG